MQNTDNASENEIKIVQLFNENVRGKIADSSQSNADTMGKMVTG